MEQAITSLGARLAVDRQGAIDEIYAALGSTVLRYLQGLVGHKDAEDVLQRVFYEVWRHNSRYDPSRSLTAWVLGIARHRAIDHLRRQRNIAVALESLGDVPGEDGREWAERYAWARRVATRSTACLTSNARSLRWRTSAATRNQRSRRSWTFPWGPSRHERSGACAA